MEKTVRVKLVYGSCKYKGERHEAGDTFDATEQYLAAHPGRVVRAKGRPPTKKVSTKSEKPTKAEKVEADNGNDDA